MKNNVLIVGGGPAGLETSAQLQRMGYNVILIEKSDTLGGHLAKWDRLFPDGDMAGDVLTSLLQGTEGVKSFTDTDVRAINRLEKSYNVRLTNGITVLSDAVVVTTGFDLFNAVKKEEYGYGIYNQVMTNADLYLRAQKDYGIRFIRGRVAEVSENFDGTLMVKAEDTVASKPLKVTLDLLVLMAGMRPSAGGRTFGELLGMEFEEDGYFSVRSGMTASQRSPLPGVFLAGAATGPKTLPDTLADARAAAIEVDRYLSGIFQEARNYKQIVRERW